MSLIEEIESAALQAAITSDEVGVTCDAFIDTPYWPRVRAALKAAQEMDAAIQEWTDRYEITNGYVEEKRRKFREAMNGE